MKQKTGLQNIRKKNNEYMLQKLYDIAKAIL